MALKTSHGDVWWNKMDYITFAQSMAFGGNAPSYSESVTDEQIDYFLQNESEINEEHSKISESEDPEETVRNLKSIIYHIKNLKQGIALPHFEVHYRCKEEYPDCPDIYDGWHRIRAYQYLRYDRLPCEIVLDFRVSADTSDEEVTF